MEQKEGAFTSKKERNKLVNNTTRILRTMREIRAGQTFFTDMEPDIHYEFTIQKAMDLCIHGGWMELLAKLAGLNTVSSRRGKKNRRLEAVCNRMLRGEVDCSSWNKKRLARSMASWHR